MDYKIITNIEMTRYELRDIKKAFTKPYIYAVLGIFFSYAIINYFTSGFNQTIKVVLVYITSVNILKLSVSIILSLMIGLLISINAVITYIKYKDRRDCKNSVGLTSVGAIGGLATGVCPLCITGLFPLIFGLFGVTFSYAALPFGGIEIQILVVIILFISLLMLIRRK